MIKRGHVLGPSRTAEIEAYMIDTLTPPGLRPIKQVKLWKKFRPFVPQWYWDELCPRPSDEVIAQVKDDKSQKRKHKVGKKAAMSTPLAVAAMAAKTSKRRAPKKNAMVMT
jgi:hypothetical protein